MPDDLQDLFGPQLLSTPDIYYRVNPLNALYTSKIILSVSCVMYWKPMKRFEGKQ